MRKDRRKPKLKKKLLIVLGIAVFLIFSVLIYKSIPNILYLVMGKNNPVLVVPRIIAPTQKDFEGELAGRNIAIKNVVLASDSATLVVRLDTGTYVYFDFTKNAAGQVNTLEKILSRLSINGNTRKPVVIDLRYVSPVMKFQ